MGKARILIVPRAMRPTVALVSSALSRLMSRIRYRPRRAPLYCSALAGESDYNICVNSDLTVSCNCRDFDGTGLIGDLHSQTLDEIFSGEVVAGFQRELFRGRLPTSVCRICPELSPLLPHRAADGPAPGRVPTIGIMVENTAVCNLSCHLCDRHRLLERRRQSTQSLEDIESVAKQLALHDMGRVCYFNLGEPFVSRTILEEIRVLRSHLPDARIITSTNGILLDRADALEAALLMDYVFFSIDGVDQATLSRYQRGGDFDRAYGNMKGLVAVRSSRGRVADGIRLPIVEWKYVMFRWNDRPEHIRRALELAAEAGVDRIVFVPGEAPLHEMSLRYFSDSTLERDGVRTGVGVEFDLTGVPERLR